MTTIVPLNASNTFDRISVDAEQASTGFFGDQFFVAPEDADSQLSFSTTQLSDERFVVAWIEHDSLNQSGNNTDPVIKAQIFSADGTKEGNDIIVVGDFPRSWVLSNIALGPLADGGFAVAFRDNEDQGDPYSTDVKIQLVSADGTIRGTPFTVHSETLGNQGNPLLTALEDGGFVVGWSSYFESETGEFSGGSKAQIFAPDGTRLGQELDIGTSGSAFDTLVDVTALSGNRFVATWCQYNLESTPNSEELRAQIFGADGSTLSDEIVVATEFSQVWFPSVSALPDGGFVIIWHTEDGPFNRDDGVDLKGQIFTADGLRNGEAFTVNTETAGRQFAPSVATFDSGGFIVVWDTNDLGTAGTGQGIEGQLFGPNGQKVEQEFLVVADLAFEESLGLPIATAFSNDKVVVTWLAQDLFWRTDFEVRGQILEVDNGFGNEAPSLNISEPFSQAFEIPENTTFIVGLNASDDADSEGNGLTYSLSGSSADLLTVDQSTGNISFIDAPDFEAPFDSFTQLTTDSAILNGYEFTVTVTDSVGLSDSVDFFVRVLNDPVDDLPIPLLRASNLELEYFARESAYDRGPVSSLNEAGSVGRGFISGWTVSEEYKVDLFRAVVLTKPGYEPVLAVRGTEGILDWMENFDDGGVGFEEATAAWERTGLRDWLKANPTASITGHSQGGAIAQSFVEFMIEENTPASGRLVTFNSPGINFGSDANDYSDLQRVVHVVSHGDIVSQVGERFVPGEVFLYDFNALETFDVSVALSPLRLLYEAHTDHWAQSDLYALTGIGEFQETSRLGGVTDTAELGSGSFSNRSLRLGGDTEFLFFEAALAVATLRIPGFSTIALTNRNTLEATRGSLNILKEVVDAGQTGLQFSLQWLEENQQSQIASVNLAAIEDVADVIGEAAVAYTSTSPGNSIDIPEGQSAMLVGSIDNLDGLSASGFGTNSSIVVLGENLSAENASIVQQSAIIRIDNDLDGVLDATITLEGDFNIRNFEFSDVGFATEIRYLGNATPEALGDQFQTSEASSFTTGNVLENDTDGDGDELSVTGLDLAGTLGSVVDNGDGTFDYDPNGAFDDLLDGDIASDTFAYFVSDGVETVRGEVTITIQGIDPDPVARVETQVFKDGRVREVTFLDDLPSSALTTDVADVFEWATHEGAYDGDGELEQHTIFYDDGRVREVKYVDGMVSSALTTDTADVFEWATHAGAYDGDGELEQHTIFYDDGHIREVTYVDDFFAS